MANGGGGGGGGKGKGKGKKKETPQQRRQRRRQMVLTLRQMGVRVAPFMQLVERALRNRWNADLFLMEVRASRPFRKLFPGIPDTWSPTEYREFDRVVRDLASDFRIPIHRKRVGQLARRQKSPKEIAQLFAVTAFVRSPEGRARRDQINAVLTKRERRKLDNRGFFNLLINKADAEVANIYEAAVLQGSDIGLRGRQARRLSRAIGQPGEMSDVQELVQRVRAQRDFLLPELQRAGIRDQDLVLLEAGQDPKGLRPTLERLVRARQAIGDGGGRQQAQRGVTGVTLFPGEEEGR